MKSAVIIGSNGQDGRILSTKLLQEGCRVVGVSRGQVADLSNQLQAKPFDIRDAGAVHRLINDVAPAEVYYLAAHHQSSQATEENTVELIEKSWDINVRGLVNTLEAIATTAPDRSRLFYAASSHIFGRTTSQSPQDEETRFNPQCVYGITKTAGIHCCRYYRQTRGVFACVGILYNHESPYRREDFVSQKIVRGAVRIKRGEQDKLVLGSLDATVDWGYAPDYVDAMRLIMSMSESDEFVVATGTAQTVRHFAQIAFSELGLDWSRHVEEQSAVLVRHNNPALVGNAKKLASRTGWKPMIGFEQMVRLLVRAAWDNPETSPRK